MQRVRRLGIRLFAGGAFFLGVVLFTRSRVPQSSTDNKPALEAAVSLITDPMVTRFVVMAVLGLIIGAAGFVIGRKEPEVS